MRRKGQDKAKFVISEIMKCLRRSDKIDLMEQTNPLSNPTIPSETPINPPIRPLFSKKTIFLIVLVVFIIILLSLVAYFLVTSQALTHKPSPSPAPVVQTFPTPTPNPTASWKTYTSNDFEYSFKYPTTGKINEVGGSGYYINGKLSPTVWVNLEVTIQVSKTDPANCTNNCPIIESTENIQIAGVNAKKLSGHVDPSTGDASKGKVIPKTFQTVIIPYNNLFYVISVSDKNADETKIDLAQKAGPIAPDRIKFFDQIVSTFKFNNQNQTGAMTNWQTYTNPINGFMFKYPQNFTIQHGSGFLSYPNNDYIISVFVTKTSETINQWILDNNICPAFSNQEKSCSNQITSPIQGSIQFDDQNNGSTQTYFKKDDILFTIILGKTDPNRLVTSETKQIYNQILSTFKFINQGLKNCTTDNDCNQGEKCLTEGPIIKGQQPSQVCVPPRTAVPL